MNLNIRNHFFPFLKKEEDNNDDDYVSIHSSDITVTNAEGKVKRIKNVNIREKGSVTITNEGIFINGKKKID